MSRETMVNILKDIISDLMAPGCTGCAYEDYEVSRETMVNILKDIISDLMAPGCTGCAYEDYEEWQEPCKNCTRNSRDYYRRQKYDR